MANITMKELLEAGVHFGHQTKRWNPKMKEYIFGERNGIYIIDLQKTLKMFKEASKFITELTGTGKLVLFVGTKRQAQDAIAEEAKRCGMPYINSRWLGGLLTNWVTVQKSVKRLQELDDMSTDGRYELLTKKEVIKLERERKHLSVNLSGIKEHEAAARRAVCGGLEQRGDRGGGGAQAGDSGGRGSGHQLRSHDGGLCDSGQRRRAARDPAVHSKIADSAAEGVQMVSEKAFATEVEDVQQVEVAPEYVGEEGEAELDEAAAEIHLSEGIAAESIDDIADDENVDMAAVLGGNIRKAPVAATEPDAEPEHIATGA